MRNKTVQLVVLALLIGPATARADGFVWAGGAGACVSVLGDQYYDLTASDCGDAATGGGGATLLGDVTPASDVIVGVTLGGEDYCVAVGGGGAYECELGTLCESHSLCEILDPDTVVKLRARLGA